MRLSVDADPALFELARVGLGALGVVAEVTLQCVPAHQLLEHTFVTTGKVRPPLAPLLGHTLMMTAKV